MVSCRGGESGSPHSYCVFACLGMMYYIAYIYRNNDGQGHRQGRWGVEGGGGVRSLGGGDLVPTMPGCVCPKVKDMGLFLASRE